LKRHYLQGDAAKPPQGFHKWYCFQALRLDEKQSSQQAHSSERLMAFLVRRQALSSGCLPVFFAAL
jgi:hypothetical protein